MLKFYFSLAVLNTSGFGYINPAFGASLTEEEFREIQRISQLALDDVINDKVLFVFVCKHNSRSLRFLVVNFSFRMVFVQRRICNPATPATTRTIVYNHDVDTAECRQLAMSLIYCRN